MQKKPNADVVNANSNNQNGVNPNVGVVNQSVAGVNRYADHANPNVNHANPNANHANPNANQKSMKLDAKNVDLRNVIVTNHSIRNQLHQKQQSQQQQHTLHPHQHNHLGQPLQNHNHLGQPLHKANPSPTNQAHRLNHLLGHQQQNPNPAMIQTQIASIQMKAKANADVERKAATNAIKDAFATNVESKIANVKRNASTVLKSIAVAKHATVHDKFFTNNQ